MKLSKKGRFEIRPSLPLHAERLAEELASWPGVQPRTHWLLGDETVVDGADFYVGEDELGHLHLDGTAHIPQARAVADALVSANLASRFRWIASWVEMAVNDPASHAHASWLFRLRYDQLRGTHAKLLLDRVQGASTRLERATPQRSARSH